MGMTLTGEQIHLHEGVPTEPHISFSFDSMGSRNGSPFLSHSEG